MERRFSEKPEPVTARRQLQYVRQHETESLEDFAHKAIKYVKTSLANQKAIFGSAKTSLTQRQVTFSDTEGAYSKEKERPVLVSH
jgi:hypothetical protein